MIAFTAMAQRSFGVAAKAHLSLSPRPYNDLCRRPHLSERAGRKRHARESPPRAEAWGRFPKWLTVKGVHRYTALQRQWAKAPYPQMGDRTRVSVYAMTVRVRTSWNRSQIYTVIPNRGK